MAAKPPPVCKAILLCREALKDKDGNSDILGVFDIVWAPSPTMSTPPFVVFLRLLEGIGKYAITAEIHDLQEGVTLARSPGIGLDFTDRHDGIEIGIPVPGFLLTHLGVYDIVVFADESEIDRCQFVVKAL